MITRYILLAVFSVAPAGASEVARSGDFEIALDPLASQNSKAASGILKLDVRSDATLTPITREGSWKRFAYEVLPVPLRVTPGAAVFRGSHSVLDVLTKQKQRPLRGRYRAGIELYESRNCVDLVAVNSLGIAEPYRLCATVIPEAYARRVEAFAHLSGVLRYRRPWGGHIEAGLGGVSQDINNPSQQRTLLSATQLVVSAGTQMWWKNFQVQLAYRRAFAGSIDTAPAWFRADMGYGRELYQGESWRIRLAGLIGTQIYLNSIAGGEEAGAGSEYIREYTVPTVSLNLNFAYFNRVELGGALSYGFVSNGHTLSVEGDLFYGLRENLFIGGRYGLDFARVQTPVVSGTDEFNEVALVLESALRWYF